MIRITDNISIGNGEEGKNAWFLMKNNFDSIINVAHDLELPIHKGLKIFARKTGLISAHGNTLNMIAESIDTAYQIIRNHQRTLVFSHEYDQRPVTVVSGVLSKINHKPISENLEKIYHNIKKQTNKDFQLNVPLRELLTIWENHEFNLYRFYESIHE